MKNVSPFKTNSIGKTLVWSLLLLVLPLVVLLIYTNFYAINIMHTQVANSNKAIIGLYLERIDNDFLNIEKYLAKLVSDEIYLGNLTMLEDDERVLALVRIKNDIEDDILLYESLEAIFVYSSQTDKYIQATYGLYELPSSDSEPITEYLKQFLATKPEVNSLDSKGWRTIKTGGNYYLFRFFENDGVYAGAWMRASSLPVPFGEGSSDYGNSAVFIDDNYEPMIQNEVLMATKIDLNRDYQEHYLTTTSPKYLITGQHSKKADFAILSFTPDNKILSGYPYISRMILIIITITAASILILSIIMRKTLILPISKVVDSMQQVRNGNLNIRIEPYKTTEELKIVNETFNEMVSQIHNLKIDIYEEKINHQKAELEHLQLQVKPHFYLNSLNIIYTLAKSKNYNLLMEMSMCLIRYFRYVFKKNTAFIEFKHEIAHIENYILIQKMRFPRNLEYEITIPEYLKNTPVPTLIIYTFVENTIKHSVNMDNPVKLTIAIDVIAEGSSEWINILIQDNGKGFSMEVLEKINLDEPIIDAHGEHIGIKNTKDRLTLLYDGKARFECRNTQPHGAAVSIMLPLYNKITRRK